MIAEIVLGGLRVNGTDDRIGRPLDIRWFDDGTGYPIRAQRAVITAATCLALVGCSGGGSDTSDASPPAASRVAAPSSSASAASQDAGVLRRDGEVLTTQGLDLVAVDPDTGESRILLDLGAGTDPPPTAVGGEVISGRIYYAAWSPDGRWLVFEGPDRARWVMNADMEIRRLATAGYVGSVWSPTDAKLAMIHNSTKLTVVDASTGRQTDLGEVVGDVTSSPVWSPDGTRILYGARGGSLHSVDVQSGERSLLVRLPGENLDSMDEIEWSPDGVHLAIMNDLRPGGGRLYVMNADGSGVRVLLDNYQPGGLAWSPDGGSIAFVSYDPAARLQTISPIEGPPFIVAAGDAIDDPMWSPDGSRIGFSGSMADGFGWFAVDADGVHQRLEIDELTYLGWGDGSFHESLFG